MATLQIIKTVDIIDNICNTLTSGFISTVVNSLCFQAAKKPFRNGIIQTVTPEAHTAVTSSSCWQDWNWALVY